MGIEAAERGTRAAVIFTLRAARAKYIHHRLPFISATKATVEMIISSVTFYEKWA